MISGMFILFSIQFELLRVGEGLELSLFSMLRLLLPFFSCGLVSLRNISWDSWGNNDQV